MIEMDVVGVRVELPANQPLVLLKERHGDTHVPIWIGAPEASAIALAQQGVVPPRPMTHDLLVSVIESLGAQLSQVHILSVHDSVFHARLFLSSGASVTSRASDAIALAIRTQCPLLCTPDVLEAAGVRIDEDDDEQAEEPADAARAESEMRQFRAFLDEVDPEDF